MGYTRVYSFTIIVQYPSGKGIQLTEARKDNELEDKLVAMRLEFDDRLEAIPG